MLGGKICFTLGEWLLFFGLTLNLKHTVSSAGSRQSFFAKLGGMIAAVWVVPALFAKAGSAPAIATVALRPEQRAIARQAGSY